MKKLILVLFLAGCGGGDYYGGAQLPPDAAYWNMPVSQPWLVDPLPQHGSSMGFMCRDAINRGDSAAARIHC